MLVNKYIFKSIVICLVLAQFVSCGGGSVTTLPEAPPPYPNFPVPYEPNSGNTNPSEYSSANPVSPSPNYPYSPPPSESTFGSWKDRPNALSPEPNYSRFTVHAKSNLWLLIQDSQGNELDWLKLQKGEKVPINHTGALTITCSSGKEVEIFDRNGRKVSLPKSNNSGISIIRLN